MDWVALNETKALADMPTALTATYETWLAANPDKASRLAQICSDIVDEFRDVIRSNPANGLNVDETTIPTSCVRAAETLLYASLRTEMGETPTTAESQAVTRAEIFKNLIAYGHFTTGTDDGVNRRRTTPAYFVPTRGTNLLRPVSTNPNRTLTTRITIPKNKRLVVDNDGNIIVEDA